MASAAGMGSRSVARSPACSARGLQSVLTRLASDWAERLGDAHKPRRRLRSVAEGQLGHPRDDASLLGRSRNAFKGLCGTRVHWDADGTACTDID